MCLNVWLSVVRLLVCLNNCLFVCVLVVGCVVVWVFVLLCVVV